MTELLAILTVIFVVYCIYEVFTAACRTGDEPQAVARQTPAPSVTTQASPVQAVHPTQPAPARPEEGAQQTSPHEEADKIVHLQDPVTGELSPVPSNYRFAKKWVKEAMVKEGLLSKVYKNSELTESVNPQVKEALEKFKKLTQYHA